MGAATNTTLPPGIEIFKPGPAIDDSGAAHTFTPADVADMAAVYDPAVRRAPLCVGHPAHDLPAYGQVSGLQVAANGRLTMAATDVEARFAEMVATRRFPNRSSAFYPPRHPNNPKPGHWYLRHVAFLGAQPPAIAGLADIQFADAGDGLVHFSEAVQAQQPTEDAMSKELQDKLDAEKARADKAAADLAAAQAAAKAANDQLAAFAEGQARDRHARHVAFAEGAMAAGKLKRDQVAPAVAVLDLVAASETVKFSEGGTDKTVSPVQFVMDRINAAQALVNFSEQAGGRVPGTGAYGGESAKGLTDAELHQRVVAYQLQHNVANYAEALDRVTSFTTATA